MASVTKFKIKALQILTTNSCLLPFTVNKDEYKYCSSAIHSKNHTTCSCPCCSLISVETCGSQLLISQCTSENHSLPMTAYIMPYSHEKQTKKQWLKWFCEAGGLTCQSQVGANPIVHTHSNPTNLALFRRKIALYRFNQGGSYYCRGGSNGSRGGEPPEPPLTLTTAKKTDKQTDPTAVGAR